MCDEIKARYEDNQMSMKVCTLPSYPISCITPLRGGTNSASKLRAKIWTHDTQLGHICWLQGPADREEIEENLFKISSWLIRR